MSSQPMKPWPPGKLHDDMQHGREEVFRLGHWSIFASGGHATVTNANWDSFVLHCNSWEQWVAVLDPVYSNTYVKGEMTVSEQQNPKQELKRMYCNTNLIPHTTKICPGCGTPIPEEIIGVWTLHNMERIQEMNSQ